MDQNMNPESVDAVQLHRLYSGFYIRNKTILQILFLKKKEQSSMQALE